jgi:subtilisin family serine protease
MFAFAMSFALFNLVGCTGQKAEVSGHQPPEVIDAKGTRTGGNGPVENWFTKDLQDDGVAGTSADKAYSLKFFNSSVAPIVVAVIDSGVDISHEDIQNRIWTNLAEENGLPGVDDDSNGYVDDIHGWNFLGSTTPQGAPTHITFERLEVTRETARMKALKAYKESTGGHLTAEEQAYLDKVSKEVTESKVEADEEYKKWTDLKAEILSLAASVASLNGLPEEKLTLETVESAVTTTIEEASAVTKIVEKFNGNRLGQRGILNGIPRLNARIPYWEGRAKYYFNESFNPRAQIIGDNVANFKDRLYGNNVVEGPLDADGIASGADHGTHVSGIIAAERDNQKGIKGIADAARIMVLRAVPDGDEYDKDIANSVRYAVDNGAKIINMSFGKGYSPYKKDVDEAFAYAARHGVLIIHSAGNESTNNDIEPSFPNRYLAMNPIAAIKGWIDVAASSAFPNVDLPADFTNFGKQTVDLFSPGVDVVSSVPGQKYEAYSGTSMAGPAVAGVAALIWSQFPTLNADEVKAILLQSVQSFPTLNVHLPSDPDKIVYFGSLTRSGGIVNAYTGMLNACQYVGQGDCTP